MGTQSILAMKRNNGSAGAYRLVGATSSQIGANFGTIEANTGVNQRWGPTLIQFESTPSIAGTVSVTNGSANIVGTATAFTTALVVGAQIMFANQPNVIYTVLTITDNTHAALNGNFTGTTNGSTSLQAIIQLLAWIRNEIYSYDGSKWILRLTLNPTLQTGQDTDYSGLFYCNVGGTTKVIGLYRDSNATTVRGIQTSDGLTWTTTAALAFTLGLSRQSATVFQNLLYISGDTGDIGHFSWDPTGTTITSNAPAGMTGFGHSFCAFKSNLYKIAQDSSTVGYWLWVLNAGVWQHVVQLANTGNASPTTQSTGAQPTLFAPGDGFMYAIYMTYKTTGPTWAWLCAKLDVTGLTGSATDISTSVFSSGWTTFGTAPTLVNTARWCAVVEGDSSPTSPTVHLFMATTNTNTSWNHFIWNGNATLIGNGGIPDDTGGDVSMAVPESHEGSGEYIWVPSDFDIKITATSAVANGVQINFQAWGPLGTESKSATFYRSTDLQIPATQMTLSTPAVVSGPASVPTLSGGNQLNGVTCDGNTGNPTTYSVIWSSVGDGVANNTKVRVTPRVF